MFFYVYLLKSVNNNYLYTGCTEDLKKRIKEHNNKEVLSTKIYAPFKLIYYEASLNIKDAYSREKYLKSRLGKIF